MNGIYYFCKLCPAGQITDAGRLMSGFLQHGPHFMRQKKGTHIQLSNYVLVTRRGFTQASHSFNDLWRRYYSSRWADGKTEAWKGDVTYPAGFVTGQFLTLGTGVLPPYLCLPWRPCADLAHTSCLHFLLSPPDPATCAISSLKSRAPSLSPASLPPSLSRLPKKLIYFSKYKWTLSHKDTTYVVSFVIC